MKKRRTKVTSDIIRKIKRLHDSGMTPSEIMVYVNLSISSIDCYLRILDAAYCRKSFCMNPKVFNMNAVADFCNDVGIPVPENTFNPIKNGVAEDLTGNPQQVTITEEQQNPLTRIADGLHLIMENLQMIASAIESICKTENN